MKKIKWLHLSDIHLNKQDVDTRLMRKKLPEYLRENHILCDYIFFTGDLRYAPSGDFAEDTLSFLAALCDAVGTDVNHLYIVPGNHDIDRKAGTREAAIEEMMESYHPREGTISPEALTRISAGKQDFTALMEQLYPKNDPRLACYRDPVHPHFYIETDDFNLLHIDTTLSYMHGRERDLIIGSELFLNLLEQLNQQKPTILLTHYSFDYLSRAEQKIILRLMQEYNVQLWFAGHEHSDLLRHQRDYFFEFQCGNLLHEDEDTKSSIILGEYDPSSCTGSIRVYFWNSPDGWAPYPYIYPTGADKSVYPFALQTPDYKINQIVNVAGQTPAASTEAFPVPRSTARLPEQLYHMSEDTYQSWKEQFDAREEYSGFLYLDESITPFCPVQILRLSFPYGSCLHIRADGFQITLTESRSALPEISFCYRLSCYQDVDERLYRFRRIKEYLSARKAFVKVTGNEAYNLHFSVHSNQKSWKELCQETDFWLEQMERIARIENHFHIKFQLPEQADETDYLTIELLSDALSGKSVRHLPAAKMPHPGLRKKFTQETDIWYNDGADLPDLQLFGYYFHPTAQYIAAGEFRWNKQKSAWESDFENGGIAILVDFELSHETATNRALTLRVPFSEFADELNPANIAQISTEDSGLFLRYVQMTHDILEIHQKYLIYQEQLTKWSAWDTQSAAPNIRPSLTDTLSVNELSCAVVRTGTDLAEKLEDFTAAFQLTPADQPFRDAYMHENISYCFMRVINVLNIKGYSLLEHDKDGYFYHLPRIRHMIRAEKDTNLDEFFKLYQELPETVSNPKRLDHYNLMRNFIYSIAQMYRDYHHLARPVLTDLVSQMQAKLSDHPELVMKTGHFADWVLYTLEGEDNVAHAFEKNADILHDFDLLEAEAEENLQLAGSHRIDI